MNSKDYWVGRPRLLKKLTPSVEVAIPTQEDKALAAFKEVNDFYAEYKRPPELDRNKIKEYGIAIKLQELIFRQHQYPALKTLDQYKLLKLECISPFCTAKVHHSLSSSNSS